MAEAGVVCARVAWVILVWVGQGWGVFDCPGLGWPRVGCAGDGWPRVASTWLVSVDKAWGALLGDKQCWDGLVRPSLGRGGFGCGDLALSDFG